MQSTWQTSRYVGTETMKHSMESLTSNAVRCQKASLLFIALLSIFYAIELLWVAPQAHAFDHGPQWKTLIFFTLPLLSFIPGIKAGNARTYAWFCFLLMIYFCRSVMTSFATPHPIGYLGIAQTLVISLLFISAMYATKWYGLIANDGISNRQKKNSTPT